MDKETIIIIAVIALVVVAVLYSTGIVSINLRNKAGNVGGSSGNMPEECKVPAGQDVNSWKEHLGHHAETKDCLKYFN